MTGYAVSTSTGRLVPGEKDVLIVPRTGHVGRRAVVMCHGLGADALRYSGNYLQAVLAHKLASAGLVVVAGDFAGDSCGNAAATAGVEAARVLAGTVGAKTDKVLLFGNSMGHFTCCGYQRDYPGKTAAVVGLSPGTHLDAAREGNVIAGTRAAIDAAWGVTYPAPLPAGADPSANTATHAGIPRRLYHAASDPTGPFSDVQAFATATGATAVSLSGSAHGDANLSPAVINEIVAFFISNA